MSNIDEYPQDATPVKTHRALKVTVATTGSAVILAAAAFIGFPVLASAQQAATNAAQVQAQAAVPAADPGQANTSDEAQMLANSDVAGGQIVVTEDATLAAQAAAAAREAAAKAAADAGPTKCPAGTVPGAYDENGNESNCQPENGNGEVCQAYNDANQCTAWGKNN